MNWKLIVRSREQKAIDDCSKFGDGSRLNLYHYGDGNGDGYGDGLNDKASYLEEGDGYGDGDGFYEPYNDEDDGDGFSPPAW